MSEQRNVTVDLTEREARVVAAALDLSAAFLEATDGTPFVNSPELRQRFLNGIVIAQAEQILYGAGGPS